MISDGMWATGRWKRRACPRCGGQAKVYEYAACEGEERGAPVGSLEEDPRSVLHPGETVADYLEARGWSRVNFARRAGLAPEHVDEICDGNDPICPDTACSLERVLGRPAHFWLNLQHRFEEAQGRRVEWRETLEGGTGSLEVEGHRAPCGQRCVDLGLTKAEAVARAVHQGTTRCRRCRARGA